MEIKELLCLNREGLIPGPGETEEAFAARVASAQSQTGSIPPQHWTWASEQLQALYDFSPRWCRAIYSSKGLAPWQAAATWIDVNRIYTIQLRNSPWVRWLVDRDELLAHEAVHAARAAFDEPQTEELFAYLTSPTRWRQVLGPIVQRPMEALCLVAFLGLGALLQGAELLFDLPPLSAWCFFAALVCACVALLRLIRVRLRLQRAARALEPLLKEKRWVRAALFRLTDLEIGELARTGHLRCGADLRWRLLRAAYFRDTDSC